MRKEERRKPLHELNLSDDYIFEKVMKDREICRKFLQQILRVPIRTVAEPQTQHAIDNDYESKGIRLDVYVNDDAGTVYAVEMQQGHRPELPRRARYYQSSIDGDLLASGQRYTELRKSFIIFICTFDPFSEGRHIYTFENLCRENPSLPLGDGATRIFLNTRGTKDDVDPDMIEFLNYIEHSTDVMAAGATNPLIREIHNKVQSVKEDAEVKDLVREWWADYARNEGREEIDKWFRDCFIEQGREIGLREGQAEGRETMEKMTLQMLADRMPRETIARYTGLSLEEIDRISRKASVNEAL